MKFRDDGPLARENFALRGALMLAEKRLAACEETTSSGRQSSPRAAAKDALCIIRAALDGRPIPKELIDGQ